MHRREDNPMDYFRLGNLKALKIFLRRRTATLSGASARERPLQRLVRCRSCWSGLRGQQLGAMHDGQDIYLLYLDPIDDSIRSFDHFADLWRSILRHNASRKRKRGNLLRTPCQPIRHALSIQRRIPGDTLVDGQEMLDGCVRPVNSHCDSPNFARTS